MVEPTRKGPDQDETARLIRSAQARAVLSGISVSLLANSFIGLTTVVMLWLSRPSQEVLWWFAALLALNAARLVGVRLLVTRNMCVIAPERALGILSAGALAGGLFWSAAPLLGGGLGMDGPKAYVIFIICGISAGALMQSTAYSRTALCFATPPLVTTIACLLYAATPVSLVVAADVLLLTVMMFRASFTSQEGFLRSQRDRLRAVALANSLSEANAEISQSYQHLESMANRDPLTGLGNRALFNERLRNLLDGAAAAPASLALLAIDLDRFKAINDTMGHGAGDMVLSEIAARLSGIAGPSDTVARLGGDEFAVIVEGDDAPARARMIGLDIVRLAGEPIDIDGRPVVIGASAGLAVHPEHGTDARTLFASADIALYAAKEGGRRRLGMFNPVLRSRIERRRQIEAALPDCLALGQVTVHFQPQVALSDGRIIGFEALLRWSHPDLGAVSPPEIVAAAHALHVSGDLTAHVARQAADLLARLPALGLEHVSMAINVSPREFTGRTLADLLIRIAAEKRIDPSLMEIEITEEAMLDRAAAADELARLEQAGFRLAVDDFGMGHSSLALLVGMRIDRLKIDRSFVAGISHSRENQALISALIGIGRALSIEIVVEGVETASEAETLRMLGCRFAQGYHFARPMPAGDVEAWLAAREVPPMRQASGA
ncbi:EAL domain-containing protein [Rhizobium sp. TRM95111]|uniref:putative bifunctional diguanylate cyclase/phosphodiesterase n=1 Tax=Rhizobium alarense TaxID=2846851 RepID=UPI001F2366EB|nr:EAL domain-containing protein [Rhizobium alarense]MCF3639885.1 EAL domain-containing protein [Rhizobium alarense]